MTANLHPQNDMSARNGWVQQHLIDPLKCARCGGCEIACPTGAISHTQSAFAIDHDLCEDCGLCLEECQTNAIQSWRLVPSNATHSVAEQLAWTELPPQASGCELPFHSAALVQHARAPRSAAAAVTELFDAKHPLLASVKMNAVIATGLSGDVHHLILEVAAGAFPLIEGQSVGILPPGCDEFGRAHHVRLYSVASARGGEIVGTAQFALTVKRVIESPDGQAISGVCSNYLCDLAVGSSVAIVGPFGESFLMPNDDSPMIMISTGVGIAPMRGMLQQRERSKTKGNNLLFYGGRTREQLAYLDELEALSAQGRLDLRLALSREPGVPKVHVQDLVAVAGTEVASLLLNQNAHLYVCGVKALQLELSSVLSNAFCEVGEDWTTASKNIIEDGRYHLEVF